jgi:stage III sporulation protein AG
MASDKNIFKHFANLRGKGLFLLLAALGVLLLLLGGGGAEGGDVSPSADLLAEAEEYRINLEKELEELCSSVRGVGRIEILLTLDGASYAVYAKDASGKYTAVGGEPVLLSREYPAVRGVAAVCEGGADPSVCAELASLIGAALNIGTNRIYISAYA